MKSHQPINPHQIRKIEGGFGFIEHRFLQDGYFHRQSRQSLILYLFLVLVADRKGVSYYAYDKICTLTQMSLDEYIEARDFLIDQTLVAFDGQAFQVLPLPKAPAAPIEQKTSSSSRRDRHPEELSQIFSRIWKGQS